MRVLLPVFLISAMIPFTAVAAPVEQTSDKAHCVKKTTKFEDGMVVVEESCTYYPDGTV